MTFNFNLATDSLQVHNCDPSKRSVTHVTLNKSDASESIT